MNMNFCAKKGKGKTGIRTIHEFLMICENIKYFIPRDIFWKKFTQNFKTLLIVVDKVDPTCFVLHSA